MPFTSPPRGEVDLRSKSGEGAAPTIDRNPSPGATRRPLPLGEVKFPLQLNLTSSHHALDTLAFLPVGDGVAHASNSVRARTARLTGKSVTRLVTCMSSPVCKNILIFRTPKSVYLFAVLSQQRGRCATSPTRGLMRWTRMVLLTRVLEADGEDVWS